MPWKLVACVTVRWTRVARVRKSAGSVAGLALSAAVASVEESLSAEGRWNASLRWCILAPGWANDCIG